MPYLNENEILNSRSSGTCRGHRGTLSSFGGLQNKIQAVLLDEIDEESGRGCWNPDAAGLIHLATGNATEGM
jgi:hypothetical protein